MRCPKCDYNHRTGRYGSSCSRCEHKFTIVSDENINDYLFHKASMKASKDLSFFFTKRNLYLAYLQDFEKKITRKQWIYGGIAGLFLIGLLGSYYIFAIAIIVFCLIKFSQYTFFNKPISFEKLMSYIPDWQKNNRLSTLDNLVDEDKLQLSKVPKHTSENDVFEYGVEGIVLVDQNYYVDWLVLNNFHFTNRVVVLSVNQYPKYLAPQVQKLLDSSENLPIYFLHDGINDKDKMLAKAKEFLSFKKQEILIDLGLFPQHFHEQQILRKRRKNAVFSQNLALDTLYYQQLSLVFIQAKTQIDETKYLDGEGLAIDGNFTNIDFSENTNFNLDFG
ncbi:MAG: hypothetical protein GY827_01405 [Cytophagales bacterium]|nr:hypothetical protein [Cytophagales bacterium]